MYKLNLSRVFDTPGCRFHFESENGLRCAMGKIIYGILGKPLKSGLVFGLCPEAYELLKEIGGILSLETWKQITDLNNMPTNTDEEFKFNHLKAIRLAVQVGLIKGIFKLDEESKVNYEELNRRIDNYVCGVIK